MSTSNNTLTFDDLEPREQRFQYRGVQYTVREASEDASVKFQNARASCMQMAGDGKVMSLRNVGEVEPLLVSLCTFTSKTSPKGETVDVPVSKEAVRQWPARMAKRIYQWILDNSDLKELDDSEEGLTSQITELTKKREALREKRRLAEAGEDDPNAHTDATTDTST